MINKYKDLYDYIEIIVKRYMRFYYKQYNNNSMNFKDLLQEAHIVASILLKKIEEGKIFNKDKIKLEPSNLVEIKRFVGNAVGRRMNTIRKYSIKHNFDSISGEKICQCSRMTREGAYKIEIDGYCLNCGLPIGRRKYTSIELLDDDYIMNNNEAFEIKDERLQITIEEMSDICYRHPQIKENDFRMFCERYVEDKTLQEIANRYSVSRERVRQKINRVIEVLKKYYKK